MNSKQALGLILIAVGVLIAFYGVQLAPLSSVTLPGNIVISGIPPRSAASIGLGAFLIVVGVYLFLKRD
ncbi:MAG: hypothetical protein ABSD49_06255 [Candidatus Bathyarchaeia archaeon]